MVPEHAQEVKPGISTTCGQLLEGWDRGFGLDEGACIRDDGACNRGALATRAISAREQSHGYTSPRFVSSAIAAS